MTFTINRLKPYNQPPTDVGTVVVHLGRDGERDIRVATADGFETIYSSKPTDPDGLERAIRFAMDWAGHRGVSTIHVVGDPDV